MKQFTKIAVVCALAVSLAACGSSASSTAASSAASSEAASSVAASSEAASEAASSEAASVAEGEGYTGTQTASAKGMNGDVTVMEHSIKEKQHKSSLKCCPALN